MMGSIFSHPFLSSHRMICYPIVPEDLQLYAFLSKSGIQWLGMVVSDKNMDVRSTQLRIP